MDYKYEKGVHNFYMNVKIKADIKCDSMVAPCVLCI